MYYYPKRGKFSEMRLKKMEDKTSISSFIVSMVNALEKHVFILATGESLDDIELKEMHNTLFCDFNIKSEKLLGNVFLYYPGTLSEKEEKVLIASAKIQYYIENYQ